MDMFETPNANLQLFTDFGIIYYTAWIAEQWPPYMTADKLTYDINFREIFAIFSATLTFGHAWAGRRILFHTDNLAITNSWFSGTSKSPLIMSLIRRILMTAALNHFTISFQHIPGVQNLLADAVSRFQLAKARQIEPNL